MTKAHTHNIGLAIWLLKCFYETFVQGSTAVILLNFCAKNRHIAKPQTVVRHPIEHPTHILTSMTLPTRPNAIFSTLQGAQNPDTKPTLQRAKNANAQPAHPG